MAAGEQRATTGTGLCIGILRARPNDDVVGRLADGAHRALKGLKVRKTVEASVPDLFGLPLAAQLLAASGEVDAIVCIGASIRATDSATLDEILLAECGRGLQQVQLQSNVPVLLGLLIVENLDEAMAKSEEVDGHNVAAEAAAGAVEMARLRQKWLPLGRS